MPKKDQEVFRFMAKAWDINKAKEILQKKPRKTVRIEIARLADLRRLIHVNEEYATMIDLETADPLIAAPVKTPEGTFYMIIDGWHRIERAAQLGVEELPAYLLTPREAKATEVI